MKIINAILSLFYLTKARREGEARVLDALVASGIIVIITTLYGSLVLSDQALILLVIAVLIGWVVRLWLRKE